MFKKFLNHEKGITGLETAIILIAFVVVAAVFAYTALSAGLFSTQKAQEAIYSGLREAQSTLELRGGIIAKANAVGDNGTVKQISFVVANVLGGEPIDFTEPTAGNVTGVSANNSTNKVVINYIDKDQTVNDLYWTISKLGNANLNQLLEQNEKFEVTIGGDNTTAGAGNLVNALGVSTQLSVNKTFTLQILTPAGAYLTIERTTPAYIDTIMNLH